MYIKQLELSIENSVLDFLANSELLLLVKMCTTSFELLVNTVSNHVYFHLL